MAVSDGEELVGNQVSQYVALACGAGFIDVLYRKRKLRLMIQKRTLHSIRRKTHPITSYHYHIMAYIMSFYSHTENGRR